jgi:manganese transport protein
MIIGWAINSAMIILAAATFFKTGEKVVELQQAEKLLIPLVGNNASVIFGVALLFSGIASSITSGMAGGSIVSGMHKEPYNANDIHSRIGIFISLAGALLIIFFTSNTLKSLILSQVFLGIQLPFTMAIQIYLTSSKKVMGKYVNSRYLNIVLMIIGSIVTFFNVKLLVYFLFG